MLSAQQRAALVASLTPQQTAIMDAFQSDTYVKGKVDVQHEPLYDRVSITNGNSVNQDTTAFFTNIGPATGKTLADTNLTKPNELPAPEAFSIFGIRLHVREDISALDLFGIMEGFAFRFVLGRKPYNTGPLWYYASGGGISGFAVNYAAPAAAVTVYNATGLPTRNGMHKLALNLVIENQGEFSASLIGTPYTVQGARVDIMCLLDGLHARGVQ
jgi:hypothetical protein